jgi:hypothetical protein
MKKNAQHIWMTILGIGVVGGAGIWAYEKYYAATTLAPGAITMATPSSGNATFALPSGARGWTSATSMANASSAPVSATLPSGTAHVTVPAAKGGGATLTWTDSTGATQVSIVAFT